MRWLPAAMRGAELRQRREALGWSQATLAGHLGVTRQTVVRWETEALHIRHPKLLRLALQALEPRTEESGHEYHDRRAL